MEDQFNVAEGGQGAPLITKWTKVIRKYVTFSYELFLLLKWLRLINKFLISNCQNQDCKQEPPKKTKPQRYIIENLQYLV